MLALFELYHSHFAVGASYMYALFKNLLPDAAAVPRVV